MTTTTKRRAARYSIAAVVLAALGTGGAQIISAVGDHITARIEAKTAEVRDDVADPVNTSADRLEALTEVVRAQAMRIEALERRVFYGPHPERVEVPAAAPIPRVRPGGAARGP